MQLSLGKESHWFLLTNPLISSSNSFAGVILVSLADSGRPPTKIAPPSSSMLPPPSNPLLGDFLALLSALFYALYLSLLKVRIKVESRVDMQLLFGFVGLFNLLACWPLGLVLHLTGVEKFGWPTTGQEWMGVAINVRSSSPLPSAYSDFKGNRWR